MLKELGLLAYLPSFFIVQEDQNDLEMVYTYMLHFKRFNDQFDKLDFPRSFSIGGN